MTSLKGGPLSQHGLSGDSNNSPGVRNLTGPRHRGRQFDVTLPLLLKSNSESSLIQPQLINTHVVLGARAILGLDLRLTVREIFVQLRRGGLELATFRKVEEATARSLLASRSLVDA